VLLSVILVTELGCTLTVVGVGLENATCSLTLTPDNATHLGAWIEKKIDTSEK
jgi:hypothetical protein